MVHNLSLAAARSWTASAQFATSSSALLSPIRAPLFWAADWSQVSSHEVRGMQVVIDDASQQCCMDYEMVIACSNIMIMASSLASVPNPQTSVYHCTPLCIS